MQYSKTKMVILIVSTVFSFTSSCIAFYLMGTHFIYFYAISALGFFIPYAFIVSEYTAAFPTQQGGIYSWLRHNTSEQFAFSMNFLWYTGYLVWMVTLFTKMVFPLSYSLFGSRVHTNPLVVSNLSTFTLPIALLTVLLVTTFAMRGIKKILSLAIISGILLFSLCFISILLLLFVSTQSDYENMVTTLTPHVTTPHFFTTENMMLLSFSITAFGGLDTIASLVGKIKNDHKQFSKAIIISGFTTVLLYILMISLWTLAIPRQVILDLGYVHLGNIMYVLMDVLALQFAQILGLSTEATLLLQNILLHFTGIVMLIMYISLLSIISYSPLKTLVEGTPTSYYPKKLLRKNQFGVAYYALSIQMLFISFLIVIATSQFSNIRAIYNQLSILTNLSRSFPYFIVACVFLQYLAATPNLLFFKNKMLARLACISVIGVIGTSIIATLIEQFRTGHLISAFLMMSGPVICILLLISTYHLYFKKTIKIK